MRYSTPLIFGETLFDCFADGEVAGGAPFNVAWHLQGLDCPPLLLSRVGSDRRGRELRRLIDGWSTVFWERLQNFWGNGDQLAG
jgi:fructokinase